MSQSQSVFDRLKNRSKATREDFGYLRQRYAAERFLYRLSSSPYTQNLILKGGMLLLVLQSGQAHRVTKDIDFLGSHISRSNLVQVFSEICQIPCEDDGIVFEANSISYEEITEDADYRGIHLSIGFLLYTARDRLQVDVGFGDVITPAYQMVDFPVLLQTNPIPQVASYNPETLIAEKLEAAAQLGIKNSRMKDFYDLLMLSRSRHFDGKMLTDSVRNTFSTRGTTMEQPMAFSAEFYEDKDKQKQWKAFMKKVYTQVDKQESLADVIVEISHFLSPILEACRTSSEYTALWNPDDRAWQPKKDAE
jgi:predicted nucleotidyltransferase component of viral defense system